MLVLLAQFVLILSVTSTSFAQGSSKDRRATNSVVARVDGQAILQSDLDRLYKTRKVDAATQPKVRDEFIDQLIDFQLLERFLKANKILIDKNELDLQVSQVKELLPKSATGKLDLQEYGYTEKVLRQELALPLMWRNYVVQTVTDEMVRDYFEAHRVELDGTEVKASQIFVKVADLKDPVQVEAALTRLARIRKEIQSGLPFADAARKYSEAPSREKGGDVGYFLTEGKMPRAFTKVAFALPVGEMSEPFVSPFGTHLCLVTDRQAGQLSLEDVRSKIMEVLSSQLHAQTIKELRAKAKIERL